MTSFIGTVAAIIFRVAFPGGRDAAAIVAGELRGVARDVDATRLIRRVAAVVVRVAAERVGNAATGCALELVGGARRFGAVLVLVRIVQTVVVTVAHPSLGDAALVVASEIPNIWTSLNFNMTRNITFGNERCHLSQLPEQVVQILDREYKFCDQVTISLRKGIRIQESIRKLSNWMEWGSRVSRIHRCCCCTDDRR